MPRPARPVDVPLKEAKLNIEHNATDKDTGFQGAIDSEGWKRLDVRGPDGQVLAFEARGTLADLGLTELFFESVEPENADVPIEEMLATLPEGNYTIRAPRKRTAERGKDGGHGLAHARHPGRPEACLTPRRARRSRRAASSPLGAGERDDQRRAGQDHRLPADHREGRRAAPPHDRQARAEHVPAAAVTHIDVPDGFLQPGTSTSGRCWRSSAAATRRSRRARSARSSRV